MLLGRRGAKQIKAVGAQTDVKGKPALKAEVVEEAAVNAVEVQSLHYEVEDDRENDGWPEDYNADAGWYATAWAAKSLQRPSWKQYEEEQSSENEEEQILREAGEFDELDSQYEVEEMENSDEEDLADLVRQEQEIIERIAAGLKPDQLYLLENFKAASMAMDDWELARASFPY
jgi:hypothetical protein